MRVTIACLLLALSGQAYAAVVKPVNQNDQATWEANEQLKREAAAAQARYDEQMAKQAKDIEAARQFKINEEQRLQQMMANRHRDAAMHTEPVGIAADIERLVHDIDPDLPIDAATNHEIIRYKVALKDWEQHDAIYGALAGVKKLGMNGIKDPPSVTISIDEHMLPAPPPPVIVPEAPKPEPQVAVVEPKPTMPLYVLVLLASAS